MSTGRKFPITPWPVARINEFVDWHEQVIKANMYSPAVARELRSARSKFLVFVRPKEPENVD